MDSEWHLKIPLRTYATLLLGVSAGLFVFFTREGIKSQVGLSLALFLFLITLYILWNYRKGMHITRTDSMFRATLPARNKVVFSSRMDKVHKAGISQKNFGIRCIYIHYKDGKKKKYRLFFLED